MYRTTVCRVFYNRFCLAAAAPESALSEGAAAALAAWRGNPTPAPGRSAAAKKKQLSAQGNNLTKYWGAPVSSSKKSRAGGATGGRGDGDGGMAADRSFEFATPDRPSCGVTAFSGGEGGTAQTAAAGRPDADLPAQVRTERDERATNWCRDRHLPCVYWGDEGSLFLGYSGDKLSTTYLGHSSLEIVVRKFKDF